MMPGSVVIDEDCFDPVNRLFAVYIQPLEDILLQQTGRRPYNLHIIFQNKGWKNMTIQQAGSAQNPQVTFPKKLDLKELETSETPRGDEYAPQKAAESQGKTFSPVDADGDNGEKHSWLGSFATGIALTLAGLALLPSIVSGATPGAGEIRPQETETSIERVVQEKKSASIGQMRMQDVIDEVERTAGDLKSLDNSPEQVLVEQNGMLVSAGPVDNLAGRGEVGVGSSRRLSENRSVSGTMSYNAETGEPEMLYAEVLERNGDSVTKKLVEFSQSGDFKTYKISSGNSHYEVKLNSKAPIADIIRSFSDGDVMREISRTAEDLKKLDDSPNEVLVEQNGMYVSAGKVDNVAGKGEVGVGSSYMISRSRGISGTMSYDAETGEPHMIYAQVQERMGRNKVDKSIEYNEDGQSRTYRISTRDALFEIRLEK